MLLATLIHRASLPCPQVGPVPATQLLEQHYGLGGALQSLGSQQDLNYRIDSERGRFVLKICRGDYAAVELQAQHAALKHLQEHSDVRVPKVISSLAGEELLTETVAGQTVHLRLLDYIDGQPLTHLPHLGREVIAGFGELCGRMSQALADFEHPGLERTLQWDPRHALELITHLLSTLENLPHRAGLERVVEQVGQRLLPLADRLPWQAVHMDITDDNVVWQRDAQRHWQIEGVIDFGDLVRTWRIADLSVTCAALLHHAEGDPFAILPAIQACHRITPLQREELQVLWPLIVARAAVLVLSSEQQQRLDPDNAYLLKNAEHEWEIFHVATSVPFELREAAILNCVGAELPPIVGEGFAPLLPGLVGREFALIDLGVLSPHFEAGNWEQEGIDRRLLEQAAVVHGLAASRYGQYRLSRTQPDSAVEPDTFALHVELHMPLGATVEAPFAGTLRHGADGLLSLHSAQLSVRLWGVNALLKHGAAVVKGQVIGDVVAPLTVQLCRAELEPPLFCTPSRAAAWQTLCPSPATLLGLA
ncbi:MAG: phosphotransferase, partial [Pseudomonas sp.]